MSVSDVNSHDARVLGPMPVPGLPSVQAASDSPLAACLAPAYIVKHGLEGGTARFAVVLGEGLGRRVLMDLLFALAPYKAHGPDRFSRVLDNWGLHDRAMVSSGSENLLQQHAASLKLPWQVFTEHRQVFIDVFTDQKENTRVIPAIVWERGPDGARRWLFDADEDFGTSALRESIPSFRNRPEASDLRVDSVVGLVTIPFFLPSLHKSWRAWQPLVRNGKSNYVGPASVPVVALMHRRAILNSRVILAAEELDFDT